MDEPSIANSLWAVSAKLGILVLLISVGGIEAVWHAEQVDLVCLAYLVHLVHSAQPNTPNKPNKL
jgi:hypothetical protein